MDGLTRQLCQSVCAAAITLLIVFRLMRLKLQPWRGWITSVADEAETPTALLQLGLYASALPKETATRPLLNHSGSVLFKIKASRSVSPLTGA